MMKKLASVIFILSLISVTVSFSAAEEASLFQIKRLIIAGSIENREPVGIVNAFSSSTEKVYCFLEAVDISEDTTASFVWYQGEQETARVQLPLIKSKKWRTYSSKKLGGRTGDWRVELRDENDMVLETVSFTVE
jgi:hypothetical protein